MPNTEQRRRVPEWAERERTADLVWIAQHLDVLWPAAQQGYQALGRGAVVVDITTVAITEEGSGNPMFYLTEAQIAARNFPDALRLVRTYEPSWQLVAGLWKAEGKESFYKLGIPGVSPGTKPR